MTLISTTTLTGATVTISSIPATYNKLEIYIVNFIPATDGSRIVLRMNSDAGANRHAIGTSGAFNATSFDMFENVDNAVAGLTIENTKAQIGNLNGSFVYNTKYIEYIPLFFVCNDAFSSYTV
jgi:hypothetical protein